MQGFNRVSQGMYRGPDGQLVRSQSRPQMPVSPMTQAMANQVGRQVGAKPGMGRPQQLPNPYAGMKPNRLSPMPQGVAGGAVGSANLGAMAGGMSPQGGGMPVGAGADIAAQLGAQFNMGQSQQLPPQAQKIPYNQMPPMAKMPQTSPEQLDQMRTMQMAQMGAGSIDPNRKQGQMPNSTGSTPPAQYQQLSPEMINYLQAQAKASGYIPRAGGIE